MYKTIIDRLNNFISNKVELNEENTKMSLILPFLQEQGYNVFDLNELQSEYVTDMRNNGGEKVDYAIIHNNLPVIFIEAKPLGVQLDKYIGQLQRYYVADKEVKYGILTDGQKYWFFADDERPNIMDIEPFYKVDLLNLKDIDIDFLKLFTRESIKNTDIIEKQRGNLRLRYFIENSIKNPDKDFIDYISNRMGIKVDKETIESLLRERIKEENIEVEIQVDESKKPEEKEQISKVERDNNKKKAPDKPISYTVFGEAFMFESWKELVFNVLNIIITRDKRGYERIKEIANTTSMLIGKTSEEVDKGYNTYGIRELVNGDFIGVNMSAKTTKRLIDIVLSKTELTGNVIKYIY